MTTAPAPSSCTWPRGTCPRGSSGPRVPPRSSSRWLRSGPRVRPPSGSRRSDVDRRTDAVFRQTGVISVGTLEQLFDLGRIMADQPAPRGRGVAVIGNSDGALALAADACAGAGLDLVPLRESGTTERTRCQPGRPHGYGDGRGLRDRAGGSGDRPAGAQHHRHRCVAVPGTVGRRGRRRAGRESEVGGHHVRHHHGRRRAGHPVGRSRPGPRRADVPVPRARRHGDRPTGRRP